MDRISIKSIPLRVQSASKHKDLYPQGYNHKILGKNNGNHHTVRIFRPLAAQSMAAGESLQREGVLGCHEQEQDSPAGHTSIY